jgi:hypothetical protein
MHSDATFIAVIATSAFGSPFWAAVVGTVVGGAVSLGTTLFVGRQQTRAAEKAQERSTLADARLAGRVILLELRDTTSVLRVAIDHSPFHWPPTAGFQFSTHAWVAYRAQLGAAAPDDLWNAIAVAYSSFEYANLFSTVTETAARAMLDEAGVAVRALDPWVLVMPDAA